MNRKNDAFTILLLNLDELKKLIKETRLCILCVKEFDFRELMQHLRERQASFVKMETYREKLNRYLLFWEHNRTDKIPLSAHAKKEVLFEYLELLDYSMQIDTLEKEYTALSYALTKELNAVKEKMASPECYVPLQAAGMETAETGSIKQAMN